MTRAGKGALAFLRKISKNFVGSQIPVPPLWYAPPPLGRALDRLHTASIASDVNARADCGLCCACAAKAAHESHLRGLGSISSSGRWRPSIGIAYLLFSVKSTLLLIRYYPDAMARTKVHLELNSNDSLWERKPCDLLQWFPA